MSKDQPCTNVLLTSAPEDSEYFLEALKIAPVEIHHLPLEKYVAVDVDHNALEREIADSENIVYGHKRNAAFLMELIEENDLLPIVTERVNLAGDLRTAELLEKRGIPAIYPGSEEPIKMLEFLMRLRRLGTVFYPCGVDQKEELPGLFKELDIEVHEHVLYELDGPAENELAAFRRVVDKIEFDTIICHSRRSVTRIQAAFPGLFDSDAEIIAADKGVAKKLQDNDVEADKIAEGDWNSILEQLKEMH